MHTPNYDFKKDLPIANKTERQIADYLETKNVKLVHMCNNSDYDIKVRLPKAQGEKEVTIEIKEDFSCQRTGNVGVEYESWGRDSGIQVSKANFYLYKIHEPSGIKSLYLIPTKKLKDMCFVEQSWFREVCGGDPGSNSWNYLFKLEVVKDNFTYLGSLPS
jgi:hypothetical protein